MGARLGLRRCPATCPSFERKTRMASTPVEVKKATPAPAPDLWQSFRQEMDRLFERFSGGFGLPTIRRLFDSEPDWIYRSSFSFPNPAVDVTEDDKAYKVTAELPGLEEKDVEVTVTGDALTIRGEKKYEKEESTRNRHMSERAYGSFQRSFALPEGIDRDKIGADMAKGVLTVTLPKTPQAQKQQKIAVKTGA
ncbi:MAG TPA: Hsp20/alpha crystallin family protein [Stellaceae bacterium]|nr:Hsp20/alpha crystallin family protein [Stellaceae bacterium]